MGVAGQCPIAKLPPAWLIHCVRIMRERDSRLPAHGLEDLVRMEFAGPGLTEAGDLHPAHICDLIDQNVNAHIF